MHRFPWWTSILLAPLLCCAVSSPPAAAQTTQSDKADVRSFQLTAVAPPTPALRYQLMFDDLGDRRPGNAALLYLDAVLLMGPDTKDKTEKALEAFDAKDFKTFDALAGELELPNVFQELELAARRERCDFEPPFREMGAMTLLPHLEPLVHATARLIKVRALRQMAQGNADDAVRTLRLGYELSNKVGGEPMLISGLIALRIGGDMDDALARLMSRPESPNLYWALLELPSRKSIMRSAMDGERMWWVRSSGSPIKSEAGEDLASRARAGEALSAEQWRAMLKYVWSIVEISQPNKGKRPDPVNDAGPTAMRLAREDYARRRGVTAEQAAKADPIVVVGEFYFQQFETSFDEAYKLRALPYPEMYRKAGELLEQARRLHEQQPANPFLPVFDFRKVLLAFVRGDRTMAALTAVEALRSYAAAHDGQLPQRLDEVTDTPVPENPATGKTFEYRLENGTGTLSDAQFEPTLTYTITMRK